jgi:RNase P/RNase MRP subunit POP5
MDIYLIRYDNNKGIIRCNNMNKESVIKILRSIKNISSDNVKIITLGTSGTIKALVNKHFNKINIEQKENNNQLK